VGRGRGADPLGGGRASLYSNFAAPLRSIRSSPRASSMRGLDPRGAVREKGLCLATMATIVRQSQLLASAPPGGHRFTPPPHTVGLLTYFGARFDPLDNVLGPWEGLQAQEHTQMGFQAARGFPKFPNRHLRGKHSKVRRPTVWGIVLCSCRQCRGGKATRKRQNER
jgi:hypothetical protein